MLRAALLSSFLLPLLSAQVPLSQAVPADMHFVVHGMTSATPDPGWVRFERAVGMLAESGIHEDVLALATLELSPAERERVHAGVAHAFALLGRVDWALLTAQEVVFAYRIALPMPEYVAAFRVPAARAGEQLTAVREMLAGFAEFSGLPPGAVHEVERESGRTVVLAVQGIPVQFAAGTTGDVLVMATSAQLASTSLRLLQAGTEGRSFGTSERFLHGRAALPPASEDELFFDVRGLFDFYRQALRLGLMGASGQGEQARRSREVIDVMLALLDEFDVIDHVQSTTCCDGTTTTSVSRVCFVADFDSTPLAAAVGRQRPWSDWHRRVPVDASGFGFDGGIDL
ncbi:MAG: hypothetical protein FJ265_23090, partial [Planctomycetes bacterium]|nr:hypothetical protein [Planctomycetota bacterium]